MENQIKNKFQLSIIGSIGIILFYFFFLQALIQIPLSNLSLNEFFISHEFYQAIFWFFRDLISYIIVITLLIGQISKKCRSKFKLRICEKFNYELLICIFFLIIGYFLWYQSSIGIEVQKIPMPKFIIDALEQAAVNFYYLNIAALLIAPLFEEIFFRGIFLEGFLNKYKPIYAILASALIFGFVHLNIYQFINASCLGMIFGFIYFKTRSLILCVFAHLINNLMAFPLAYLKFSLNRVSFLLGIIIFITAGILFINNIRIISENDKQIDRGSAI